MSKPQMPTLREIRDVRHYLNQHGMPESPHGSYPILSVLDRIITVIEHKEAAAFLRTATKSRSGASGRNRGSAAQ